MLDHSITWRVAAWVVPGLLLVAGLILSLLVRTDQAIVGSLLLVYLAGQLSIGLGVIGDELKKLERFESGR